jgi:hypothetical protein
MTKDTASSDVGKTKAPQPLETNEATNAPATNKVTGSAEPPPGLSNRLQSRATSLPANDLLYLQRTIGNRAVNDLLQRQERPPQAAPSIPYAEGGQVSSDLEQRIRYTQAGGSALPTHTQR